MRVRQTMFGQPLYLAENRIENGRDFHIAVVTNRFVRRMVLDIYWLRWVIENLFSHLNKRGLDFEKTHLRKTERIERLVAVLSIAFTLCYRWGRRIKEVQGSETEEHGYRPRSVFRFGFESLHVIVKRPARYLT